MTAPTPEDVRHYGNMRFAMFTVFTAIVGALLLFAFDEDHREFLSVPAQRATYCVASLLLTIGFGAAEVRISRLVTFYQEKVFTPAHLPPYHHLWKWLVPIIMLLPYVFAGAFWILYMSGCVSVR